MNKALVEYKKYKLIPILVVVCMAILSVCVFALPQEAHAASTNAGKTVVIDPGHQYISGAFGDTGALSPNFVSTSQTPGETEAYLNVQMAYKLCHELQERGYTVYSTSYIATDIPNLIDKSKGTSYSLRDRINASATVDPYLYISVHHNCVGTGSWCSASGLEILYDNTDSVIKSRSLAMGNIIYNSVATLGSSVIGNRYTHVKNQAATVLTYNTAPAVTIEVGFMDNVTDLKRIKNESSQQVTAEKIADGVTAYLTQYPSKISGDRTPPTADYVVSPVTRTYEDTFQVYAMGVKDDEDGVASVQFAVWSRADMSDLNMGMMPCGLQKWELGR